MVISQYQHQKLVFWLHHLNFSEWPVGLFFILLFCFILFIIFFLVYMDIYYTWIDITDDWSVTDWRQTLEVVKRKQSSNFVSDTFVVSRSKWIINGKGEEPFTCDVEDTAHTLTRCNLLAIIRLVQSRLQFAFYSQHTWNANHLQFGRLMEMTTS